MELIDRQVAIDKAIKIPVARIVTEDKVLWRKAVFVEDIEALPAKEPKSYRMGYQAGYKAGQRDAQAHTEEEP